MTNEKLDELNNLADAIEDLEAAISHLENTDYKYLYISGMNTDGVPDTLITTMDRGTEGLIEHIITFLNDKLVNMKKKFEEA